MHFPSRFVSLTTPVAYISELKPDICAVAGPYAYARLRTGNAYVLLSTGPDGRADIGPEHLLLTMLLAGKNLHDIKPGTYVGWSPDGYELSPDHRPGMDMVRSRR